MGRHIRILVLAAAAQPALALCASDRCRVIIQVFLLSFIFVAASVVASSVYICACRQARGQCKVASAAAAVLNVLFIVVWTVYVAVAVTKIEAWSGMWWIFVVDALAAGLAVAVAGYLILRARAPDPSLGSLLQCALGAPPATDGYLEGLFARGAADAEKFLDKL